MFDELDAANARIGRAHLDFLVLIARLDEASEWEREGARDAAHWLGMRYGISEWKARRWIAAARALQTLPRLREALASGELGIDKVVELARFATLEDEARLIVWAQRVSCGAVRRRGDLVTKPDIADDVDADRGRFLHWWYTDEGRRFGMEAELPAAQGAVVARALERVADDIPAMPDEEDLIYASARRADALVAICSSGSEGGAVPARAAVVIHAQAQGLHDGTGGCELENGPVIHPDTVRRALCDARVQTVFEHESGRVVGLGRMRREPPAWMIRQVRYRDRECRFPGCGAKRFTEAHHIVWWRDGGRTELDNLLLICSFHHRLVHEHRWRVERRADGEVDWFRPDGFGYHAGQSPGEVGAGSLLIGAAR